MPSRMAGGSWVPGEGKTPGVAPRGGLYQRHGDLSQDNLCDWFFYALSSVMVSRIGACAARKMRRTSAICATSRIGRFRYRESMRKSAGAGARITGARASRTANFLHGVLLSGIIHPEV